MDPVAVLFPIMSVGSDADEPDLLLPELRGNFELATKPFNEALQRGYQVVLSPLRALQVPLGHLRSLG